MNIAITRRVSPAINQCELTHISRERIDYERACVQHKQYENALRSLGMDVISLDAESDLPDSVFVEDVALVLDECAIMLNPGAASRRPEVASVERALAPYREIFRIQAPATVDGGDILTVGKTVYVGLSKRSTKEAIEQMKIILEPRNYEVRGVRVTGCLHLKSAVTQVSEDTLLFNPEWVSKEDLPGMKFIEVDPSEPYAANTVLVDDSIIYPLSFPKTQAKLQATGIRMLIVDADELAKAEGAVTCCSLIFTA
ncbi:MAG: arginine deiminase family protein [Anaerolineales bacterium]|jgi:dimethylargininase